MHQNWQNLTDTVADIDDIGIGPPHLKFQLEWIAHRSTEVFNVYVLKQSRTLTKFDQPPFKASHLLLSVAFIRINSIGTSLPSGSSKIPGRVIGPFRS